MRLRALTFSTIIFLVAISLTLVGTYNLSADPSVPTGDELLGPDVFVISAAQRVSTLNVPTVDGRLTGDESYYYVLGTADNGRGTLYYNLVGNTLYLLMRVDPSVNDNVFGKDPDDATYVGNASWSKHRFKDLLNSDHIQVALSCGTNSWTWAQDYLYDADGDKDPTEKDWLSDPNGNDGSGTPPPGLASASSLQWNLNNTTWDITLGGSRTGDKDYKSPDPMANYPNYDATNKWEWAMVYEMKMDVSACGSDDIIVSIPSAHNSPSKDGNKDVPITPTVVSTPTTTPASPTPTPTPTTTPTNPPRLVTSKEATPLAECQKAEIRLHVSGAGDPIVQRRPLDVMIVLDRSGSMLGTPLADAKQAAKTLIDQLDPSLDQVGLVSYATTASLDKGLTNNFVQVKTAIDSLVANGYTNIGDAVFKAQAELNANGRSNAVPVIVLLSDGVANRSHAGDVCTTWPSSPTTCTDDAINQATAAKNAGTVIYTIGLNLDDIGQAKGQAVEDLARNVLKTMASSPANYFESPASSDLQGIFNSIANIITNAAGTNVVVTDILPPDVHYVSGSAVPAPSSISGQTLTWNLGLVGITQTHTITFQVYLDPAYPNQLVDVYPDSRVDYINYQGNNASVPFPETRVTVNLCATPTPTPTDTPTPTPTPTPTDTPTPTPTPTDTPTPTPTPSPGITVSKEANLNGNIVLVGEVVTFTVRITNTGGSTIVWLPLRDTYDNTCLEYSPKSANPVENNRSTGVIDWYDLTTTFSQDLLPGKSFTLTIPFTAVAEDNTATNTATVHNALDEFGNSVPTTAATDSVICRRPASIGDYIWNDANGNGIQDEGAGYGINGVTVRLYKDDGDNTFEPGTDDTLVATQVTAGDGAYDFTMLHAGTYWVDVDETSTALAGYTFISGSQSGPEPHLVTVNYGDDYNNADFGYAGKGTISGTVFYDWNKNGSQDAGENGIGGVEVCLYKDVNGNGQFDAGTDTKVSCQNTASDGTYAFTDNLPGKYLVVETQPSDLQDTTPNVRAVTLVVVGASGSDTDNNFGEIVYVRIGDFAWIDSNGDGVQDAGETSGVPNLPIHITGVNAANATVDITVTTSITGYYMVDNLLPGTYTVTAPASFSGFVRTSTSPLTTTLTVTNREDLTLDFGYISPTAVQMASFQAESTADAVTLQWTVWLDGEDAPRFHIWRAVLGGRWKQLTLAPIAPTHSNGQSAAYTFEDTTIYPGTTYLYRLESDSGEVFGPWQVNVPDASDVGGSAGGTRLFIPFVSR